MKEKAIGLDLGTTSLGIAVSDSLGLVHPRKAFFFPKKAYRRAIAYFYSLVEETGTKTAALGLPLNMDGTEGPRAEITREFGELLTKRSGIPVIYVDERLTTVSAERMLIDADVRRDKRKKVIDKVAATIILQSYLDSKR